MFEKYGKGCLTNPPSIRCFDIWEKVFNPPLEKSGIVFLYLKPIGYDSTMVARCYLLVNALEM